jgi:ribose-phosphate pyrophosphokinase
MTGNGPTEKKLLKPASHEYDTNGIDFELKPGNRYALAIPNYGSGDITKSPGFQVWAALGKYQGEFDLIPINLRRFGDGGGAPRLEASPEDREIFVPHFYNTRTAEEHTFWCAQISDALKRAGSKEIYFLETYNPFYRQDSRTQGKREAVTARLVADLYVLSGVDTNYVFDPHFRQLEGFFPSRYPMKSLDLTEKFAGHLMYRHVKDLSGVRYIGVALDEGGVRPTRRLVFVIDQKQYKLKPDEAARFIARMDKERLAEMRDEVRTNTLLGDVKDKDVIIREDVIGTGTTLEKGVRVLRDANAGKIIAVATYAGDIPEARRRFFIDQGVTIVTTDGIPYGAHEEFSVMNLGPVMANVILRKTRALPLTDYMSQLEI